MFYSIIHVLLAFIFGAAFSFGTTALKLRGNVVPAKVRSTMKLEIAIGIIGLILEILHVII